MAACRTCGESNAASARFCHACGTTLAEPQAAHEVRKTVTVLFADVAGSTSLGERLDPEALRSVMSRYFDEMRDVLERHGGTVEKFIGDAVMAVFGVPVVHEDDALRAVRAAAEMLARLKQLNQELVPQFGTRLEMRIGVNTGPVVAGDPSNGQTLVTGDTVNLAKRLEQAAPDGSILIGKSTYPLVKDAVQAGPLQSFKVKGKAEPVSPLRLDAVDPHAAGVARRLDRPFIGRLEELAALQVAFRRAEAEQSCRLFTVLGSAGIGKSRLVAEFIEGTPATVLIGRCLPYGEGISLWPFREIVRALGGAEGLAGALAGADDAELVVERLMSAVGAAPGSAHADETPWAFRRLLETVAQRRPVVVVLEDIHWAAPVLLDLVEYLLGWLRGPVLLVCLARPDLLELRPGWVNPRVNADAFMLDALAADEAESLLDELQTNPQARARITEAAEGNPLFLEQMAAMLAEKGDDAAVSPIPPSIQALLAARLDQLDRVERAVVERAAVVGREFSRAAVTALSPPELEPPLAGALMALVRKELLVPQTSDTGQDDGFRFGHILIRDAAYEAVPKKVRAQLHERLADWLDDRREPAAEEIIGYHLEQAYHARAGLGQPDDRSSGLASRAGGLLAAAGRRALGRDDFPAAISLLERAGALLEADPEQRSAVLIDLGLALREAGRLDAAGRTFAEAEDAPTEGLRCRAVLERSSLRTFVDPQVETDELLRVANHAIGVFESNGDDLGLARAWLHVAEVQWLRCHCAEVEEVLTRGLVHAERADGMREVSSILSATAPAVLVGPRPVSEAIATCRGILERGRGSAGVEGHAQLVLAVLEAMSGRLDEARGLYTKTTRTLEDMGLTTLLASLRMYPGMVELLAGDYEAAERELKLAYDDLAAVGHSAYLSTTAAFLAKPLYELGREEDALAMTRASEEAASPDDIASHVIWRGTRAKVLARRGEADAAVKLANEAVDLLRETDLVNTRADAYADLAETMRLVGGDDEAAEARAQALALYEAKGNLVSAAAMRQT